MLISVIGGGKVGTTLCKLWHGRGVFEVREIVNQSLASAHTAIRKIGAGKAVNSISMLREVDIIMISTSDSKIEPCATELAKNPYFKKGTIVFHCSGALSSFELQALKDKGAFVCSAHPAKSFSGEDSYVSFSGTHVALEGGKEAIDVLSGAFSAIGALPFIIPTESKVLYHSALCMVSNYLPALLEVGVKILLQTGMTKDQALNLIEPLVRGTMDNIFSLGTVKALTGPISRGDAEVVSGHLYALESFSDGIEGDVVQIYRLLGEVALGLARLRGGIDESVNTKLSLILNR